jgi:hypothetical protein
MVERFFQSGDDLFAILSNGELWVRMLNRQEWQHVLSEMGPVKAMSGAD